MTERASMGYHHISFIDDKELENTVNTLSVKTILMKEGFVLTGSRISWL